jgi:hypothetical protein
MKRCLGLAALALVLVVLSFALAPGESTSALPWLSNDFRPSK